ncbi:integrase, catalytic region, zinc finger, CCHC-type containing protein [Tanacetum coccineum]
MMNELVRNKCEVTNHQVDVQFLLKLQPEWKRLARTANPLALVAQQQPVYHHQNHPTQNTQYSSTRPQQSTRNRGKAIVTYSAPTYDPVNCSRGTGYDNQRAVNVVGARENVGTQVVQKSGIQCYNCKEYGHVSRECQKPKRVKEQIDSDDESERSGIGITLYVPWPQLQERHGEVCEMINCTILGYRRFWFRKELTLSFWVSWPRYCIPLTSISLQDSTTPNPICLMAKATSSQAWLWHLRLSYLNFDTINLLSKNNIVNGLPELKFVKDHLGLHAQVTIVRTDKGTEFLNKSLHAYFAKEGIRHETSTARTPEQNGVVERRNRTLVEAARTMLSAAKVPLFFWAEAIATACFTQNRSLVIPRHEKKPYHIINARKPSVKFFHIFGSLCYINRDGENLDKMKEKGDACIFVGYSTQSKAYRVFNKRTRMIVETIHVNFDEL